MDYRITFLVLYSILTGKAVQAGGKFEDPVEKENLHQNLTAAKYAKLSSDYVRIPQEALAVEKLHHERDNAIHKFRRRPSKTVPAKLRVKAIAIYNSLFSDYVVQEQNLASTPEDAILQMVDVANQVFRYDGLGTTVTFDLLGIQRNYDARAEWEATGDWLEDPTLKGHTTKSEIDHYVFFTRERFEDGTAGIAHLGSACVKAPMNLWVKTSIIEVQATLEGTAYTLAHEVGHALGMPHDFLEGNRVRIATNGESCTDVGGVMDYSLPKKWTACSRESLAKYYKDETSNYGVPFCLDEQEEVKADTYEVTADTYNANYPTYNEWMDVY